MSASRHVAWLAAVLSCLACRSEPPPTACRALDATGPGPKTFAELRDAVSDAACGRFVRCGLLEATDEPQCVANLFRTVFFDSSYLEARIASGRFAVDPTGAEACVDALRSLPCDASSWEAVTGVRPAAEMAHSVPSRFGAACWGAVTARVENGYSCGFSFECCSGHCDERTDLCAPAGAPLCPSGQAWLQDDPSCVFWCDEGCHRLAADGGYCPAHAYCEAGLRCIDHRCTAPSTRGGPCGDDLDCSPGLHCQRALDEHFGACAASLPADAPCSSAFACPEGLVCRGLQTPLGLFAAPGAPPPAPFALGLCTEPVPSGSPCAYEAGPFNIVAPPGTTGCFELSAVCDETLTCVTLPGPGEACVDDHSAHSGCALFSGSACSPSEICETLGQ